MLTTNQQKYLNSLPSDEADRIITIKPYNLEIANIAKIIINQIKEILPSVDVEFMGASALGISGQNDIDIYVLAPEVDHLKYFDSLTDLFGEQNHHKWSFNKGEYEVSVYLADPTDQAQKEQIDMFTALKTNPELLREYEQLKASMDGKSYKEYQTAKYEFYNKVLFSLNID